MLPLCRTDADTPIGRDSESVIRYGGRAKAVSKEEGLDAEDRDRSGPTALRLPGPAVTGLCDSSSHPTAYEERCCIRACCTTGHPTSRVCIQAAHCKPH
jgi:hypothetical protein